MEHEMLFCFADLREQDMEHYEAWRDFDVFGTS